MRPRPSPLLCLAAFLFVVSGGSSFTFADEHLAAPNLGEIVVADGGDVVSITPDDVLAYHGHPCPGGVVAFRAVQYAMRLLWADATPSRDDIVIFSRGSMHGVLDVFALVTKGPIPKKADAISQPSPVLKEMKVSHKSFMFTVIRRSTGETVDLRVNQTVYPKDYFLLRKKVKQETASGAEKGRLKKYQHDLIERMPELSDTELFELPIRYRVLMFGA